MIERWTMRFTEPVRHARTMVLFSKAMYALVLVRLLLSWPALTALADAYVLSKPRSILAWTAFGPGEWAVHHITMFMVCYALVLLLALWLRPNYFTAAIIAWLYLNVYRISFPMTNGADEVTTILLFLAIPLTAYPVLTRPAGGLLQRATYHLARLFIKLSVCAIYVVSGVDKLASATWRSGEAMGRVRGLTYAFNPLFDAWVPETGPGAVALAWLTIGFELLFPVLVWFRITRKWILITGVAFHLLIAAMLTLPEFAAVMIVSYTIFLELDDKPIKT